MAESILTKTEMYALAQILVCGEIDYQEFRSANDFLEKVQKESIDGLDQKGVLDETLYQYE